MENELVRYSRAGDVFHYRWAARRCLRMIYPGSRLRQVIIEGSSESALVGEYSIDVAEYASSIEGEWQEIAYFQLKHTTVRKEQPFKLSDLKSTVEGFAQRFSGYSQQGKETSGSSTITFSVVSNRPVAEAVKQKISMIGKGGSVDRRFQQTLEKYTSLVGADLSAFCGSLQFADGEGDYNAQRYELHVEIARLLAGTIDSPQIDSITTLVQEKALPDSDGHIYREDILRRFGVTSEKELLPAPPQFEKLDNAIPRKQHDTLLSSVVKASTPVIIHASAGVGKTVFACQVLHSLPASSFGVVYDCFGAGRYRNRSEPRHRHRDGLVEIANELASQGLCEPLIAPSIALEDEILRKFLLRLDTAAKSLKKADENAVLVILVDAADNAEMAAKEYGQPCFVHELLRETLPDGCRLVALCRTERIHLLQPASTIPQLELEPFSVEESLFHLRGRFPQATDADGLEFHRLTTGNPRVQANALASRFDGVAQVLASLGPAGTTVEEQIESQLQAAISTLKEKFPIDYQAQVEAICLGLANLPPFIPIDVLATAAQVDEAAVRSLVADLGRPLWLSDSSVQFRDEPTESWFRDRFSATAEQIVSYITRLKPLAYTSPYVAETLPSLLLQAEKHDELISLALADDFLPKKNPIDERNVRVYRLQFAFKAALGLKRYDDATRLALRAGEEVAGNERQLKLLRRNVDLIAPLQSDQRVQELAFRRMLYSGWDGSENAYSAALLSSVNHFHGEARAYLRAAMNWLRLYFEERKKNKQRFYEDRLEDDDIVELAFAHFDLFGASAAIDFVLSWRPPEIVCDLARKFTRRLIDAGNLSAIEEISLLGSRNQYLMIAVASELLEVGRVPSAESLEPCLALLSARRTRIPRPRFPHHDTIASALVSFAEACAAQNLAKPTILRVLRRYVPIRAPRSFSSRFPTEERDTYLRAVALRSVLLETSEPDLAELLPEELLDKQHAHQHEQDVREFKELVGGLLPWYMVRCRALVGDTSGIVEAMKDADQRSTGARSQRWRDSGTVPYELSRVWIGILTLWRNADGEQVERFFGDRLEANHQIRIADRLRAVRAACRLDHLSPIRRHLEQSASDVVDSSSREGPETRAEWYIDLARAVLSVDREDAAAYFDHAIEAVSRFGDEIVQRWEAVAALTSRCAEGEGGSPELAYRFIRCADLVGENVADEDHFDRNGAIRTCVRLSPVSAFAALSRWRDRDVGWFSQQLPALADEMVRSDSLSPAAGWALSAFFGEHGLADFASLCIEREPSAVRRQYILDSAIRDLRLDDIAEGWHTLRQVAAKRAVDNKELDEALAFYSESQEQYDETATQPIPYRHSHAESATVNWEEIIAGLDLTSSSGISQAIQRFAAASTGFRDHAEFWQRIITQVDESKAVKFLQALVDTENAGMYDIENALRVSYDWRRKASVKQHWERILERIGQRFASRLTNHWTLKHFLKGIQTADDAIPSIHKGMLEGLSGKSDVADASTFFGFVEIASTFVSPPQATSLLDFALARFERHIDDEFADGRWGKWLEPPGSVGVALAGFIWSALGSPRADTRWRAAHCVRRLAEIGCEAEIDALIEWMEHDGIDAFGSRSFPFYNLHARQYLLIALARVSIDNPHILKHHWHTLSQYALAAMSHILIQRFAAEAALNVEKAFPNTYSADVVEQLRQVNISQLPIKEMASDDDKLESYWHASGMVDTNLKFYHGWDFDRYWFEPLGHVFGISGKQVEELATEIVIKEWQVVTDGSFQNDPRAGLWRSGRNERETWHDHGSYPRADNLAFYFSYHSMLVIAARLLRKMPVVHRVGRYNSYEDEWNEWLREHSLTRDDGRWLADRRDPVPLSRPTWTYRKVADNWRSEIAETDFLNAVLYERQGETWLTVFGGWVEGDSEREESFHVATALVSPIASRSLLNALTTCVDPNDFKLPDYEEERMEFKAYPFILKGWIARGYTDNRLDRYDAHGADIGFPPYRIGQSVAEKLGLFVDSEQREWFLPNVSKASLVCELWSTNKTRPDDDPLRRGERLSASLTMLKNLCLLLQSDMVFEVRIGRRVKYKQYMSEKDENGYKPALSKIYLLSGDGSLRDAATRFQLG
jgi:hypothetical protein